MKTVLTIISFLLYNQILNAQISVITNSSNQLVTNLIGNGVLASNITSILYPGAHGSFTSPASSGLGLQSGIILSTGTIGSGINQTTTYLNSTNLSAPGDPDLDLVVSPLITHDAQVLEFDFSVASDSISFNFIFASEEYNEFVNSSYSDVFAFYVSGPGYAQPTNIALLPGTVTPVSINTVNNGNSSSAATGPCTNCNHYRDNIASNLVYLSIDGLTTVINVKFPVMPCTDYHFKIVIADTHDEVYDSMVFLGEESFSPLGAVSVLVNGLPEDTIYICPGDSVMLSAAPAPNQTWNTGATSQSIIITQPGNYSYVVTNGICFAYSEIEVLPLIPTPIIAQSGDTLSLQGLIMLPGMSCQWNIGGVPLAGETQTTYVPTGIGCYTLTLVKDSCEITSNTICITGTSLDNFPTQLIHVFPIPASDHFFVEAPFNEKSETKITVYDLAGRILLSNKFNGKSFRIENRGISKGIYMLEITNSDYRGSNMRKLVFE